MEILPTLTETVINGETYFKSETVNLIIDRLHLAITDYKKLSVEYKVHNRILAERLATAEAEKVRVQEKFDEMYATNDALTQRLAEMERIVRAILDADERGQGLPFKEAMDAAKRALKGQP